MAKQPEPTLEGDKFILVGYINDLAGQQDDFYEMSNTPFIESFDNDKLWRAPYPRWSASQAKAVRPGEREYVTFLNTNEHVLISENQYMYIAGTKWLTTLEDVSPELAHRFDDWKTETGSYNFKYRIAEVEQHKVFNTALAHSLEEILLAALKTSDVRTASLSFHLYELASTNSLIPRTESIIVAGAYCSVIDAYGLSFLEHEAKVEKLYRNHRKWSAALTAYQKDKGL